MATEEAAKTLFRPPAEPIPSPRNRDFLREAQSFADFLDEPITGMQIDCVIPLKTHPMYAFTVDRVEENEDGRLVLLSYKSDNVTFGNLQKAIEDMTTKELREYSVLISNVRIIGAHIRNHFNWPRPFNTQIV